jgi:hypothetical protein
VTTAKVFAGEARGCRLLPARILSVVGPDETVLWDDIAVVSIVPPVLPENHVAD